MNLPTLAGKSFDSASLLNESYTAGYSRVSTHLAELLQGRFILNNRRQHGLVTLPDPVYCSHAHFRPDFNAPLSVIPIKCGKALLAAQLTLRHIEKTAWGGLLTLEVNIPECMRGVSSTGDVVSTVRAVAKAFKVSVPDIDIAKIAVAAETASDR